MNSYKQQLLELSTELYQRATDKAKKYQRGAERMSAGHTQKARAKGRENPGMNAPKVLPHISLSLKYKELAKERKQQVGKFSAASKGVKTKRPGRGYPLGAQQANLVKQSQIEINREKREDENTMNNFDKALARKLMEMKKGPDDKTYDPDDPKGTRSMSKQHKRNVFAGELQKHRKEVTQVKTTGKAEDQNYTAIAGPEDIEATGKNLKKMRRKTGKDPIPDFTKGAQDQEFRHVPRGRVATTGGGRTDPAQRGGKGAEAYQQRAQGEGEASQTQKQVAGQAADVSKDQGRRSRDTDTGHGAKKTRLADMKKKATEIRVKVRKQKKTSLPYSDIKDPDATEVAGTRGKKPPRDMEEYFQSVMTQALVLNEIGDTARGKDFISKAWLKRRKQVDTATDVALKTTDKHGVEAGMPATKSMGRLARGELQMSKVGAYMGGRMHGEEEADKLGYKGKHKQRFGDEGAKLGRKQYDDEYKEGEKKLDKRAKKGKWGPKGKGVKQAVRDIKARSRAYDWNEGMPPGDSVN